LVLLASGAESKGLLWGTGKRLEMLQNNMGGMMLCVAVTSCRARSIQFIRVLYVLLVLWRR
jgi:hypothetical protein